MLQPALRVNQISLRWILLAFVPSNLMLSVTTFISTDVAARPMLWVVPLAPYLLTFIPAFSKRQILQYQSLTLIMKALLLPMVLLVVGSATETLIPIVGAHLFVFFIIALTCHTALAQDRPEAKHLTEFYLFMSLGGALGGTFNALIAPFIFNTVTQFPLILGLAALVVWRSGKSFRLKLADIVLPTLVGGLTLAELAFAPSLAPKILDGNLNDNIKLLQIGTLAVAVGMCVIFLFHPLRFGLAFAALFVAGAAFYVGDLGSTMVMRRSFFGVSRVTFDTDHNLRRIMHGTTVHGIQSIESARACEPMGYYTHTSPIGQTLCYRPRFLAVKQPRKSR